MSVQVLQYTLRDVSSISLSTYFSRDTFLAVKKELINHFCGLVFLHCRYQRNIWTVKRERERIQQTNKGNLSSTSFSVRPAPGMQAHQIDGLCLPSKKKKLTVSVCYISRLSDTPSGTSPAIPTRHLSPNFLFDALERFLFFRKLILTLHFQLLAFNFCLFLIRNYNDSFSRVRKVDEH